VILKVEFRNQIRGAPIFSRQQIFLKMENNSNTSNPVRNNAIQGNQAANQILDRLLE